MTHDMTSIQKLYLIGLILVTSIGCDQVSKNIAKNSLANSPPVSYLGETFRLQYAENTGAFLGLGSGLSKTTRFILFTFLSGGLLIALFFYTVKSRELQRKHIFALSLILGGGGSNMIDRVFNDGKVIGMLERRHIERGAHPLKLLELPALQFLDAVVKAGDEHVTLIILGRGEGAVEDVDRIAHRAAVETGVDLLTSVLQRSHHIERTS